MIIREATSADTHDILPLLHAFVDEGKTGFTFDKESAIKSTQAMLGDTGRIFLMTKDEKIVGVLAGVVMPFLLNYKQTIFQEIVWYVLPEYRGRGLDLLVAAEALCKREGIDKMIMVSLNDLTPALPSFYRHRGFKALEQHWMKDLKNGK